MTKVAIVLTFFMTLTFMPKSASAEEECREPIGQWQPREVLKKRLEEQGWVVQHIRIDDGCYQVRALDEQGRRVKATYTPGSLTLLKLKIKNHEPRKHRDPQH